MRWLITLGLVLLAGLAGWLTAREYHPPRDDGESRLRERVLAFYKASPVFDYQTMVSMYTPAQQTADSLNLNAQVARWKNTTLNEFDEQHRSDLQATAAAVRLDDMEIQTDGDWAVVKGTHQVFVDGKPVEMPLDTSVWLRTGGDWWLYQLSDAELCAYGNPPDFARKILFSREFEAQEINTSAEEVEKQRQQQIEEQKRLDELEQSKEAAPPADEQDGGQ